MRRREIEVNDWMRLAIWLFDGIDRIFAGGFERRNGARNEAGEKGDTESDGRNFG